MRSRCFDAREERSGMAGDAAPCAVGIESTIVAVEDERLPILRAGPITPDELVAFGEVEFASASATPNAPGQLKSHMRLGLCCAWLNIEHRTSKCGLLAFAGSQDAASFLPSKSSAQAAISAKPPPRSSPNSADSTTPGLIAFSSKPSPSTDSASRSWTDFAKLPPSKSAGSSGGVLRAACACRGRRTSVRCRRNPARRPERRECCAHRRGPCRDSSGLFE